MTGRADRAEGGLALVAFVLVRSDERKQLEAAAIVRGLGSIIRQWQERGEFTPVPDSTVRADLVAALKDPSLRGRLQQLGLEPIGSTPAQLAAVQKADLEKWAKPVKASPSPRRRP